MLGPWHGRRIGSACRWHWLCCRAVAARTRTMDRWLRTRTSLPVARPAQLTSRRAAPSQKPLRSSARSASRRASGQARSRCARGAGRKGLRFWTAFPALDRTARRWCRRRGRRWSEPRACPYAEPRTRHSSPATRPVATRARSISAKRPSRKASSSSCDTAARRAHESLPAAPRKARLARRRASASSTAALVKEGPRRTSCARASAGSARGVKRRAAKRRFCLASACALVGALEVGGA